MRTRRGGPTTSPGWPPSSSPAPPTPSADLSARARLDRIADGRVDPTRHVALHDGSHAGVGDLVLTRRNDRRLTTTRGRDWVKNGDLWRVTAIGDDASLDVVHTRHHGRARLPAAYVAGEVELGYATTIHRAQGITADTAHVLVDEATTRQALYTALTRGRRANHVYVTTTGTLALDADRPPAPDRDAREVLLDVLARDGAERPATHVARDERAAAASLARLVPEYLHAYALHAEHTYRLRQVAVEVLGPDVGQEMVEDGAWPALAATLAAVGGSGGDVRTALAEAAGRRELASAESVAEVLAWRLQPAAAGAARGSRDAGLPAGIPPPPPPMGPTCPAGDPALAAWLAQRADRIRARLDALTTATRTRPPAWLDRLGPRPDDAGDLRRWDDALRGVLAYRDQHAVTDPHSPLGPRPDHDGPAQRTWDTLTAEHRRIVRQLATRDRTARRGPRHDDPKPSVGGSRLR